MSAFHFFFRESYLRQKCFLFFPSRINDVGKKSKLLFRMSSNWENSEVVTRFLSFSRYIFFDGRHIHKISFKESRLSRSKIIFDKNIFWTVYWQRKKRCHCLKLIKSESNASGMHFNAKHLFSSHFFDFKSREIDSCWI